MCSDILEKVGQLREDRFHESTESEVSCNDLPNSICSSHDAVSEELRDRSLKSLHCRSHCALHMFQSFGELPSLFGECCGIVLHDLEHVCKVGLHHSISVVCPSIYALTHRSEYLLHLDGILIHHLTEITHLDSEFRSRDLQADRRERTRQSFFRQEIFRLYAFESFEFFLQFLNLYIAGSNVINSAFRQELLLFKGSDLILEIIDQSSLFLRLSGYTLECIFHLLGNLGSLSLRSCLVIDRLLRSSDRFLQGLFFHLELSPSVTLVECICDI